MKTVWIALVLATNCHPGQYRYCYFVAPNEAACLHGMARLIRDDVRAGYPKIEARSCTEASP